MIDLFTDPAFWAALFSVTLIQVALGADNLIIITVLASKLPAEQQRRAVTWGLALAMAFRLVLLALVSWVLRYAVAMLHVLDVSLLGIHVEGKINIKALVLVLGGFFLIWSGVKELRLDGSGNLTILGTLTTGSSTYPDYVFDPEYRLMPLDELGAFIAENSHLPDFPVAAEVAESGLNISETQIKLIEKVEELTLYTLEQQELIEQLQSRLEALEQTGR